MSDARAVRIDLARARTIVDPAIAHARSRDFPLMTVAVLDIAARRRLGARHRLHPARNPRPRLRTAYHCVTSRQPRLKGTVQ